MITDCGAFTIVVDAIDAGKRLDVLIAARLSHHSRSFIAHLIADGRIQVQGRIMKPGYRAKSGDRVEGIIPPPEPPTFSPEPIPIDILFEDEALIVINKQPGLVVHPSPGHGSGTLVNALLYHCPTLGSIGGKIRPGIVHRLDKDTSGVLVVAKNDAAHHDLAGQFKSRKVQKHYLALVHGPVKADSGTMAFSIGRHPVDRKKMSTRSRKARGAETRWKVKERFDGATLLDLDLKTGRTHQIRVHCAAIGHPVVGDAVYGGGRRLELSGKGKSALKAARQMLHAQCLQFTHPADDRPMSFEAPLPADMAELIEALRNQVKQNFT
ncbi:MAG: RluA family pseudouridine synthase [Desulfobacterales bacterium]|nr:RluA family pseudouridine synthase [Desulfobacterales bacterium]